MKKKHPLAAAIGISLLMVAVAAAGFYLLDRKSGSSTVFSEKLGVISVLGTIDSSDRVVDALDKFGRNDEIKGILLRVESPGGGVAASQEIYTEILRTRKKYKKPVVCSMGGVAASGGYYIASACDKIVASPGTLTGSIGVILSMPDLQELFGKIGVKLQVVKAGKLKGTGMPNRPLSPEERAMLQGTVDEVHEQFIFDVAKARNLPMERVRALATGGIYTGQKAMQLGLVDQMGNITDAVELTASLAHISGRPKLVLPEDKSKGLLRRLVEEDAKALIKSLKSELGFSGAQAIYHPAMNSQP